MLPPIDRPCIGQHDNLREKFEKHEQPAIALRQHLLTARGRRRLRRQWCKMTIHFASRTAAEKPITRAKFNAFYKELNLLQAST